MLRLYPAAWRERYGDEFGALLEECQLSVVDVVDVLWSAVDAHLHADVLSGRTRPMLQRLRRAEITVFCAWIAFVLAGLALQKLSEYDDFREAARTYPVIGASYLALEVGAVVALLAVLAGGIPLALSAVSQTLRAQRGGVMLLFGVPLLALMALVVYGYIVKQFILSAAPPTQVATPQGKTLFLGFIGLLILGGSVSAGAVSVAISRSEIDAHWYRFARIPTLVATLAMVVMGAGTIAWGLALRAAQPTLFNGEDGIVATSTALSWLVIAVVMTIAALAAVTATVRGLSGGPSRTDAGIIESASATR